MARETGLRLLIGGQSAEIHGGNSAAAEEPPANGIRICEVETRRGASDEAVIVPPVERNPRQILKRLILNVRGLLKLLVVVDTEGPDRCQIGPQAADLRMEKARRDAAGGEKCRQPMKVRQAHPNRRPINLGTVPGNREENRCVQEIGEVIPVVRVLPQVVVIDNEVLHEGLLEARVKFIPLPWKDRRRRPKEGRGHGITHSGGEDQVLVERGLYYARVRYPQNRIGPFDVVSDSSSRLRLVRAAGDAAIEIAANPDVEGPTPLRNCVLKEESHLF